MAKTVTTRLPDEFVFGLNKIAKNENLDVSSVIRKLLASAIKEWKIEKALELYKKGNFSFGQLVEFAEVSPWDVPYLLKEKKVLLNYDLEELEVDLESIKWKEK